MQGGLYDWIEPNRLVHEVIQTGSPSPSIEGLLSIYYAILFLRA